MIGSGSSDLAIGISLILRDQFSGTAAAATRELTSLSEGAQSAVSSFQNAQRDFSAGATAMGAGAIAVMASMTKVGADFDATLTYISKIASEKGGVGFDKLSQRALQLGQDSMYSAGQVADAMKYLAMSGMDTEAIYNNVAGAVALASATMSQLEGKLGTADIMTNIMHAFRIEGTEANAMHVADVLSKAVTSSNTNLLDFAEGMKYAQGTAHSLGLSLEETAAIIMMMGNAGIQGSMSGTATENMLRYLSRMGDEARSGTRQGKALSSLGLGPEDLKTASGDLKSIHEIFTLISRQLQGMGNLDAVNLIQDMFGVRGARAAVLMREISDYTKNLDILENSSTGTALANQQAMMATTKGLIDEATGSLETLAVAWFHNIRPVLDPLIKAFAQVVEYTTKLIQTPVGKWTTVLISGLIVIGTAFMGIRTTVLTLTIAQQKFNAAVISTGASSRATSAGMIASTGTYNGLVSKVVGKLQMQKVKKAEILALQRQQTAEVMRTLAAETTLTGAQRSKAMAVAATTAHMSAQQQMLMGVTGVTAMAGIGGWLAKRGIGKFYTPTRNPDYMMRTLPSGGKVPVYIGAGSGREHIRSGYNAPGGRFINRAANVMGRGSMFGMLGGMALSYAGEAVGTDTQTGKGLSMAGNILGMGSTGAMVGSMLGPWGTVIGGLVGGVGGLIMSLQNDMEKATEAVESAKKASSQTQVGQFWNDAEWIAKAKAVIAAGDRPVYMASERPTLGKVSYGDGINTFANHLRSPTRIIINIDGKTTMDKQIDDKLLEQTLNIGY